MMNTMLGIKKGMTSAYDARGRRVGATVLSVGPNYITQIKTVDKDGYEAVQLGFGTKKSIKKPQLGQAKKIGLDKKIRWFKEVRTGIENIQLGQEIKVDQVFSQGDAVRVTGISKGKGFAGGVKRYGFAGGPKTHGQSDRHRAPGSIGSGTTPGRVYKGKRMAGHMGVAKVSVRGLEVIGVDKSNNLLLIKGAVPGPVGSLIKITKLGQVKGYTPPPEEKEEPIEAEAGGSKKEEAEKVEEARKPEESQQGTEKAEEVKEEQENA